MVRQVLELLGPRSGGVYCDATLGTGGHTLSILEASAPAGRVVGVDRDRAAIAVAAERLGSFGAARLTLHHGRFSDLAGALASAGVKLCDGVLLDLGLSSLQLQDPLRGMSFMRRGPVDMRMDTSDGPTALELLHSASIGEIERMLREWGEERWSARIARSLHRALVDGRIGDTLDLASEVRAAIGRGRSGGIDSATRSFQALRIAVNCELQELEQVLEHAPSVLRPGGVLVCISYHSLEDRIVKHALAGMEKRGEGTVLTRRPLRPDHEELSSNRRARSARLRAMRRVTHDTADVQTGAAS